jgi:hypothetical protein
MFNIEVSFKAILKSESAEIDSTKDTLKGDEILICLDPQEEEAKEESRAVKSNQQPAMPISHSIDLSDLLERHFSEKTLLREINGWAQDLGFRMFCPNGIKKQNKGFRRVVSCCNKECPFRLFFLSEQRSEDPESETETDEVVEIQEDKFEENDDEDNGGCQERMYYLTNYNNEHNHKLDDPEATLFTEEMLQELNSLKGKMRTLVDLQNHMNKAYKSSFTYSQIVYQVNKLLEQNFGKADDDAHAFINAIQDDIELNGGQYKVLYDEDRTLRRVLYVSKTMLDYSEKFLDTVLVDATYRRNRFNMPLINVAGVNNHGRTIILAFALMDNEKVDAYNWLFKSLKEIWKREPNYFVSDECPSIISGFFSSLYLCNP